MNEGWQEKAADIGRAINRHATLHPELQPLVTAWVNFASKHGIAGSVLKRMRKTLPALEDAGLQAIALNGAGLKVIARNKFQRMQTQISRQSDEIEALEYRIKTLLER